MLTGYTYRHKDAKVGLMAPLEVLAMYIYVTEDECRTFMSLCLRDPQDFAVLEVEVDPGDGLGGGDQGTRITVTPVRVLPCTA
jgi:hypothetical protein